MRAHGQATAWDMRSGGVRASASRGWLLELRQWWADKRAAHRRAMLAALENRWDARREVVRPWRADTAFEMAAAHGTLSVAVMLDSCQW